MVKRSMERYTFGHVKEEVKNNFNKKIYCGRAQKKAEREGELKAKYDKLKQERIQRYQGKPISINQNAALDT